MAETRVLLINSWDPPVSLYIYSRLLLSISDHIGIIDINDVLPSNPFRKNFKNFVLTFTGINIVYKIPTKNYIVHYIDPAVAPLSKENKNIVTIWDNPFKVLNTDLYMESFLMKMRFKENIRRFSKNSNVITPSNYIKKSLEEYGFDSKIMVIPAPVRPIFKNIPDKIQLRKDLGLPLEKKLILSISVDVKRKNLDLVKKLSYKLGTSYRIVRIGESVGDCINFQRIDDDKLIKIYNACDVLFIPSFEEGQGFPIAEAFKTGLPVVASDIPVFREIAGNAAVFIDPMDEISALNGIRDAISRTEELIEKGNVRSKLFDYSLFKQKMLNYYGRISGEHFF